MIAVVLSHFEAIRRSSVSVPRQRRDQRACRFDMATEHRITSGEEQQNKKKAWILLQGAK
jgi:hypothetical protein